MKKIEIADKAIDWAYKIAQMISSFIFNLFWISLLAIQPIQSTL